MEDEQKEMVDLQKRYCTPRRESIAIDSSSQVVPNPPLIASYTNCNRIYQEAERHPRNCRTMLWILRAIQNHELKPYVEHAKFDDAVRSHFGIGDVSQLPSKLYGANSEDLQEMAVDLTGDKASDLQEMAVDLTGDKANDDIDVDLSDPAVLAWILNLEASPVVIKLEPAEPTTPPAAQPAARAWYLCEN